MKLLISFLVLGAYAYGQCRSIDNGSCWNAINESSFKVDLACTSTDSKAYGQFFKTQLDTENAKSYSKQFDTSWGDGMGFPEPQTRFTCQIKMHDSHKSAQIDFETLNWGDRVQIKITDRELSVLLRSNWNQQTKTCKATVL